VSATIRAIAVPLAEKPPLWDMLQRYIAELAVYIDLKPVDGGFAFAPFDTYWTEDGHWPFWAMREEIRVGFALVSHETGCMRMKEFYIAPEFRRGGAGSAFARGLLAAFPGTWKIRQMEVNAPAVAFWRRVAAPYGYTETAFEDKGIARIEQTFVAG
jgi:predicted acetyltransferase